MTNFYDNLNKVKQGVHLSAEAKQKGKEQLLNFIRANEVMAARTPATRQVSWFAGNRMFVRAGAAFAVFVMVGGGTTLAAENSLPGDALYTVKLNVNEKLAAITAVSAVAKANLAADLAAKRLDEVNQLSIAGRMNAEAEVNIENNFDKFSERVAAKVAELEAAGDVDAAADVSARFESSLAAHANILAKLEARGEMDVRDIKEKVYRVLAMKDRSEDASIMGVARDMPAVPPVAAKPAASAEGRIKAASNVVASAKRFVFEKKDMISPEAKADAELRLNGAISLLAEAKANAAADEDALAAIQADQAMRMANETKVLVVAQVRADSHESAEAKPELSRTMKSAALNFLAANDDPTMAASSGFPTATMIAPDASTSTPADGGGTSGSAGSNGNVDVDADPSGD